MTVWTGQTFLGSGFFMAKQVVATCSHVLRRIDEGVHVEWRGVRHQAEILARERDDFPDVAFLGLTSSLDHQFLHLEEANPQPGSELTILGSSKHTPEHGIGKDIVRMRVTGQRGRFIKVTGGRLVRGLSGSPVIDEAGLVIGVAKAKAIGYGETGESPDGWVVPASVIRHCFYQNGVQHKAELSSRPTLIRPDPRSQLSWMLKAQRDVSAKYPYRIAKLTHRPVPPLSMVYVEQRVNGPALDALPISPIQMIRKHRHMLVVGGPGGGKSTLLQQVVALSAEWWLRDELPQMGAQPEIGPVVAMRVSAADLLRPEAWDESIARAVNTDLGRDLFTKVGPELFHGPPVPGAEWLILIDGLDEVLSWEHRIDLIRVLGNRVTEYGSSVRFAVASRRLHEREFQHLRDGLTTFDDEDRLGEYQIRPFDGPMLKSFAQRWFRPQSGVPARRTPESFLQNIADSRIRPLVEVPLMATIAAVVHEESPDGQLAEDRAGLYEQFVAWLLTRREQRRPAREALVERMAAYGQEAVEVAEFLFSKRYDCLAFLADRRLRDDQRRAEVLVGQWLRQHEKVLPYGVEPDVLQEFLLSTGLVELHGDDLQFTHRSLAEFLAAKIRVESFDPHRWLREMAVLGPDSIGLFTATEWRRAGNDLLPAVERLIEHREMDSVAVLLQDGVTGDRTEEVIQLALQRVNSEPEPEVRTDPIRRLFRAVLQRGSDRTLLPQLLASSGAHDISRIEAARVLLSEGTSKEKGDAAETLAELAYGPRLERGTRLRAVAAMAEAGDRSDRIFAMQHLTHLVETHEEDAVRGEAIRVLAQIGEHTAAIMALMRRSSLPGQPLRTRLIAMTELGDLLEYVAAINPEVATASGPYAPAWTGRAPQPVGPRDAKTVDIERSFVWSVADGIAASVRFDPEGTRDVVRALMRDRTRCADAKFRVISALKYFELFDLAFFAATQFATDPLEPGPRRVVALQMPPNKGSHVEAMRILRQWVTDPLQDLDARHAALQAIGPTLEDAELEAIASDRRQGYDIRVAAAVLRGGRDEHHARTRGTLMAIAQDHRPLSPAWLRIQLAVMALDIEDAVRKRRRERSRRRERRWSAAE